MITTRRLTSPQVAFDQHFVLLLIPPGNNEEVLGGDEPEELLEPAKKCE